MAMAYATLISRTSFTGYTIETVPTNLKSQVLILLKGMGLDGQGNPLSTV
ncbi:hypothetical protein [Sporosarcina sp. SAFN-010]